MDLRIKDLHWHNEKEKPYNIFIVFVCLIALLRKILTYFSLSYLKYSPDYEINNIAFALTGEIQSVGTTICFTNLFYIMYLNIPQMKKRWEITHIYVLKENSVRDAISWAALQERATKKVRLLCTLFPRNIFTSH